MSEGEDEHIININSHQYLDDTLDGIQWNGNSEDRRKFPEAFTEVLRTCGLTGRAKLIIRQRFLSLYRTYYRKFRSTNIIHNTGRIIITIGSIIIPALITLDNEISERSQSSQIIYYTTFSVSLLVTITNALTELMQISKKYYTYATVKENLRSEGWLFLSLSGKYKHYGDHSECWRKFVNNVEKYNSQAATSELILSTQKPEDTTTQIAYQQLGINPEQITTNESNFEADNENVIYALH